MTRTILVTGTASHVGKSTVVTGLCRHLADNGISVAPFKAQNMANNARVVPCSTTAAFGEIGNSQYVQARAAGINPETDVNPILLKPSGANESQLIVNGQPVGHFSATDYYDTQWKTAKTAARDAYHRLAETHDIIIAEGAGSISELNLHHRDIANKETARFTDADIILLADIERGGAFGALYGNIELAPPAVRTRIVGTVITKFQGDRSILTDALERIKELTDIPVLGVIPYLDPGLPAEDSVSIPPDRPTTLGDHSSFEPDSTITILVPRLPRISNFTDFDALASTSGVRVIFVPLTAHSHDSDAMILPGTKNTVADLRAIRDANYDTVITEFDGPIIGICGGYQLLGTTITNADIENPNAPKHVPGLGLLPISTTFSPEKRIDHVTHHLDGTGPLEGGNGPVTGYEIHMGDSHLDDPSLPRPIGPNSAATDTVLGTYLHGLFENDNAREAFVTNVFAAAGKQRPPPSQRQNSPFTTTATMVRDHIDLNQLELPL